MMTPNERWRRVWFREHIEARYGVQVITLGGSANINAPEHRDFVTAPPGAQVLVDGWCAFVPGRGILVTDTEERFLAELARLRP